MRLTVSRKSLSVFTTVTKNIIFSDFGDTIFLNKRKPSNFIHRIYIYIYVSTEHDLFQSVIVTRPGQVKTHIIRKVRTYIINERVLSKRSRMGNGGEFDDVNFALYTLLYSFEPG